MRYNISVQRINWSKDMRNPIFDYINDHFLMDQRDFYESYYKNNSLKEKSYEDLNPETGLDPSPEEYA